MAEVQFKVRKVTAVPVVPVEPNTLFFVANPSRPDYVEIYISSNTGQQIKRVVNEDDIKVLIRQAIEENGQFKYVIVADINARNTLQNKSQPVFVKNATADSSVKSGGAFYLYDETTSSWVKVSEAESMDVVMRWADIQGKPTSTPQAIDTAVTQSHTHANITQLDKIGQDAQGNLLFGGKSVATTINDAW